MPPDKEAQLARYRKTVQLKDAQKKRQQALKGAMRQYILKKMQEQNAQK